ncbi:hypothetical protein A1OE_289 [Candidatus Endolissoclinum faulkneri L2]|uniref:Uncharacterized protein n=1 Tax=Candidatus Endolissoclinum faulkneri L2 TaxID=1193729 RepID=K7YPK1_9PROT|nr:hypothetical protein A1OE_289 [Candidatus Endolissoclinum faulkneri L2]
MYVLLHSSGKFYFKKGFALQKNEKSYGISCQLSFLCKK